MSIPYITSTGLVTTVLNKIKTAQTPERFTQDFLGTKLGLKSGSAKALIPLLKKIGFLGIDGVPTEIYKRFRNVGESQFAMAQAIKIGYADLYESNEYIHDASAQDLRSLIISLSGGASGSSTVKGMVGTFQALKSFANFEEKESVSKQTITIEAPKIEEDDHPHSHNIIEKTKNKHREMNLSYSINIVLPETTNIAVFNAIFKSINENLLK